MKINTMEQATVAAHHDQTVVNRSGSTQDLLNYLDEEVPEYFSYRGLRVIGHVRNGHFCPTLQHFRHLFIV